jgi:hypothetical protein
MKCTDLAQRIESIRPGANVRDVARLCLLLSNSSHSLEELYQDQVLEDLWQEMDLRMQAATDQHAAMTEELECLARSDPQKFSPDQIWILIRAIKVQSQVLQFYVGEPALDV